MSPSNILSPWNPEDSISKAVSDLSLPSPLIWSCCLTEGATPLDLHHLDPGEHPLPLLLHLPVKLLASCFLCCSHTSHTGETAPSHFLPPGAVTVLPLCLQGVFLLFASLPALFATLLTVVTKYFAQSYMASSTPVRMLTQWEKCPCCPGKCFNNWLSCWEKWFVGICWFPWCKFFHCVWF